MGFGTPKHAQDYVKCVVKGNLAGTYAAGPGTTHRLWQLSRLLSATGFDGGSDLVKSIRDMDPGFEFPPDGDYLRNLVVKKTVIEL